MNNNNSDLLEIYFFDIDPCAKPRMTRSDKWKKRKVTENYWQFKTELRKQAKEMGLVSLPIVIKLMEFGIKMPDSWSEKKKQKMENEYHIQRPDLDNLIKAINDALCDEDSHIAEIRLAKKIWVKKGYVKIGI